MSKDFDKWNEAKKIVEASEKDSTFFFHEREVWWCAIGTNVGVEADGKHDLFERPVLIIRKFNKEMFWGVPFTSHAHAGIYYVKTAHEQGVSWAALSQLRTWSSKRLLRKIGRIPESDFAVIVERIAELTQNRNPAVRQGFSEPEGTNTQSIVG